VPDKRSAGEQLKRLFELIRFLTERGERGATLEEIRPRVYAEDKDIQGESLRRKFDRDIQSLKDIYDIRDDESHDEDDDDDDVVDIVPTGKKDAAGKSYYRLKSRYTFMLPMRIRDEELHAMVVGTKLAGHFIKPLESAAVELWHKLKGRLPGEAMDKGEKLSQAIALAMPVSKLDNDKDIFKKALQAIDEKKILKVRQYRDREGNNRACTISPYALYFKYHAWYLMGMDAGIADTPTVFRLNRMRLAEVLENGAFIECPWDEEELRNNIEMDFHPANASQEYSVRLRITGFFMQAVMETEWFKGEKKTLRKDCVEYEVKLKGFERITLWIMRALDCIEVLEPKELKTEIDRRVDAYLARRP
jgi:predicted DNA-binding transcriptional regulator YafY